MRQFRVILGFLLIGGIAYAVVVAVRAMIHGISLNPTVGGAVIAATGTVFVSVLSIVLGKVYESRSLIKKEHREKKIPVYEDLIKLMFRIMVGEKTGNPISEKETIELLSGFTERVMVWGSDEVLAAWVKWRRLLINEAAVKANPIQAMFLYEEVLFAIRRDLGHKNKDLKTGDILALFVNDVDQHLPKKRS